jgi:hypothetical protein
VSNVVETQVLAAILLELTRELTCPGSSSDEPLKFSLYGHQEGAIPHFDHSGRFFLTKMHKSPGILLMHLLLIWKGGGQNVVKETKTGGTNNNCVLAREKAS